MLNLFLQLYSKYNVLIAKLKKPLLQGTEGDTINLRSRKAKTSEISNKYTHGLPDYSLVVCDILTSFTLWPFFMDGVQLP